MPRNTEVQAQLARVVGQFQAEGLVLDPAAQQRVGELIATAADTLEAEGRLDDPAAVGDAEHAIRRVLTGAYRRSAGIERREAGRGGPALVKEAAIIDVLRGICPLWPIC